MSRWEMGKPRRDSLAANVGASRGGGGVFPAPQQSSIFDYAEELEAKEARRDLMRWIGAHPAEWEAMEALASEEIAAALAMGRKPRVSVGYLVEETRRRGVSASYGDMFAVNNNLRAAMARYLVELHPEWSGYIARRRSKADKAFRDAGRR